MKRSVLIISVSLFFLASGSLHAAVESSKGKHLVEDHISALNSQLKNVTLNSAERRKLESYLRRYFDNKLYNQNRKLSHLDNAETRRVADSITNSYQDILKTSGTHKQAATHFALQAGGLIAYYTKPSKRSKEKGRVTPSRATEKPETKQVGTSEPKPKGWLQEAESMVFGNEAKKPIETKPVVAQPKAKPVEAKTAPSIEQAAAKKKTEPAKKEVSKTNKGKTKKSKANKKTSQEKAAHKQAKMKKKKKAEALAQ